MLCVCIVRPQSRIPRVEAELESLFLLVPIALIFVAIALKIFFWAIKSGQYDNLDTEAHRILFDDDEPEPEAKSRPEPTADAGTSAPDSDTTDRKP